MTQVPASSTEGPNHMAAESLTAALLGQELLSDLPETERAPAFEAAARSLERIMRHGDLHTFLLAIEAARQARERGDQGALTDALQALGPWKKGPFDVAGVKIDAEWDCHMKWDRVLQMDVPLEGRTVVDIGSGNGFYARQFEKARARRVFAVEQSVRSAAQFMALQALDPLENTTFFTLRAEELPVSFPRADVVFSMGVLYHVRSPLDHLALIRARLRSKGLAVIETLALESDNHHSLTPKDRYAGMRNVWFIPTPNTLVHWLERSGFRLRDLGPLVPTTPEEQRATVFATGPSLVDALAPDAQGQTVEGYPAPQRVIAVAEPR
ncbi:MAG: tRNA 5-methoxyuridine(34)/uridine 5-oxyacetic acid(34) synthase CmoB [Sorangiineae bacterium NIC37A_2]|jgi:tRNA (mo5U34)-methyltransferase|nr:MAG: tRNA 5-methoxyuridine(34)/uridine 5-oxyacetic acid(34) synthase CmoB [Sorangiineae bacterium NIC37A_2]